MRKDLVLELLNEDHPAKAHGFNWSVAVYINNAYCGNGKYFRTREEAETYKKEMEDL